MTDVHDDVTKSTELGSSNRLGEEITYHFVSRTVFEREVFSVDNIGNEEVSYIHALFSCYLMLFHLFPTVLNSNYLGALRKA